MKKRIVSAFLVLTVLLTLAVVPASATVDYDSLIAKFITEVYDLQHKEHFVDMLVLMQSLNNPDEFSNVYDAAYDALSQGYKDTLDSYKITSAFVVEVAQELNSDGFSKANLEEYLGLDDGDVADKDKDAFEDAVNNRKDVFITLFETHQVSDEILDKGFDRMDKVFDFVDTLKSYNQYTLEAKYKNSDLEMKTNKVEQLLGDANKFGFVEIEDVDSAVNALGALVTYYNNDLDSHDKPLVYDYLKKWGFIYIDDDDDDNGGGSSKPPVTPVTPPVIDDNEQELDDLLDDLINPEDPDQQVSEEELQEIIEEAVELAEKVVEQAGTADVGELAVTTDDKAAVDLSDLDLTAQIEVAQEAANKMKETLGAAGVEEEITTSITFTVPEIENVEEVEVTLPPLQEVFEKVDIVKVTSEVASFEIDKETFGEDSGNVTLSAARVDDAVVEELLAKQPEDNKIPADAVLIDLNAHVETTDSDTGETTTTKVSSFNKKITVSLPYQLAEGQDPEKVSVYLVKDDGTIVKVAGKFDEETGMIEFTRKTFSYYYVAPSTDTFTDLANYGWARQAIEVMAGKGVIGGRGSGIFDPGADITRAEFAALLTRLLQLEGDFAELTFTDVTADCWFRNDVAAAYQAGIINGRSATIFDPKANITRQEAAAMVTNALEYLGYDSEKSADMISDKFTDFDRIAPYALNSVATLYRKEIIKDLYEGEFSPKMNTTRAETAMMLYKLFLGY